MEMEFDTTTMVKKIAMQAQETEEEFIFKIIQPYCENILAMKINKKELEQILLKGMQTKWIPISEGPPEDYSPCWCTIRNHHTYDNCIEVYDHTVIYDPTFKAWYDNDCSKLDFEVIAWMPIPEPYKPEIKTEQALAYADQDTLMPAT